MTSPLDDDALPDVDAVYAGGGFPEVYARELSANRPFLDGLRQRIEAGMPVWAECGGLMVLARAVIEGSETYPMVGALPVVVVRTPRPQGHGYVRARIDRSNPFLPVGAELVGHEFHYSRLQDHDSALPPTVLRVERGVGVGAGRDGIQVGNVVATYTHLHALGTPEWAPGLVRAAAGRMA